MTALSNLSEKSKEVMEFAMGEAQCLGHNFLGSEQLLVGLVGTHNSVSQILREAGITLKVSIQASRKEVL